MGSISLPARFCHKPLYFTVFFLFVFILFFLIKKKTNKQTNLTLFLCVFHRVVGKEEIKVLVGKRVAEDACGRQQRPGEPRRLPPVLHGRRGAAPACCTTGVCRSVRDPLLEPLPGAGHGAQALREAQRPSLLRFGPRRLPRAPAPIARRFRRVWRRCGAPAPPGAAERRRALPAAAAAPGGGPGPAAEARPERAPRAAETRVKMQRPTGSIAVPWCNG